METYYHLEDLPKFKEIGKDAYELEKKILNIMMPYCQPTRPLKMGNFANRVST